MNNDIGIKIGVEGAAQVQADLRQVAQATQGMASTMATVGQAMGNYTQMTRDARVEANLLRQANRQLAMQMTDVVTSLASGMPAWMVFIQQGGQIKDSYGGIGQAISGVSEYLRALVNPLTLAAAGFAGLGAAMVLGRRETNEYIRTLTLTGNAAGFTASQLDEVATAIGRAGGSQSRAAAVLTEMARQGGVGAENLQRFTAAAIDLERAGGPAAEKTAQAFAKLADAPLAAALELNKTQNFLTASTYEQIKALEEQGQMTQAADLAQKNYAATIEQRAPQIMSQLGYVEQAWKGIKDAAIAAGNAVLDVGRDSTQRQIQSLQARISIAERGSKGEQGLFGMVNQRWLASLKLQLEGLREVQRLENDSARAAAERARQVEATVAVDKRASDLRTSQQKMEIELAQAINELNTAQSPAATRVAVLTGIMEKYATTAKTAKAVVSDEAKATAEALKTREKYLETLTASAAKMAQENTALADQVAQVTMGKDAYQRMIDVREEEQAVILETQAIRALDRNLDQKEFEALKGQAAAIRERIALRQALTKANAEAIDKAIVAGRTGLVDQDAADIADTKRLKSAQDIVAAIERETAALNMSNVERETAVALLELERLGIKKGTYAYDEYAKKIRDAIVNRDSVRRSIEQTEEIQRQWQRTADQIGQSLSDALMQGGKSAWEYIKGLFRTMVLRPVIQAIVNPIVGAFGGGMGFASAANASAGGGASTVSTLTSAYNALNTSVSTAITNGYLKLAESPLGAKLGLSTPTDFGTGFTANIPTSSTNAFASALGTAGGTIFGTAAGMAINKAISNGFQVSSGMNTLQNIGTAVASYMFGPIGGMVAGAISGAVNRVFGRRLADVGLQGTFGAGAGFEGQSFQFFEGGFLRSDKTKLSPADTELQGALSAGFRQIQVQTALLAQTVGQSAEEIGNFTQDIKLSFKDLTEEQIKEKLAAQLTSVQEQLASLALGASRTVTETLTTSVESWSETEQGRVFNGFVDQVSEVTRTIEATGPSFARTGETAVQTLQRLAGSISTINPVLETLNLKLYDTSLAGADLASQLADAFGGLDAFTQATGTYYQEFFSEAERAADTTQQLTKALGGLGLALPTTRDEFRALVEAQDLSTESGRKAFATLVGLSGTFAALVPQVEAVDEAATGATQALRSAADILRERQGLERELLQLQGDTTALRALDRAALDESNRALFDRITALQDSQAATEAAAQAEATLASERERVAQERAGLNRQLLELQGDTAAIRALERAALDESNRALFDRIAALRDAQAAETALTRASNEFAAVRQQQAQAAAGATDAAFAAVRRAIDAEAVAAQAAITGAYNALVRDLQQQTQAATALRQSAAETLQTARSLFDYLGDQIEQLRGSVGVGMTGAQGRSFIEQAIAAARATGSLPEQQALAKAVAAARGDLDASRYGSAFELRRDSLILAGRLTELQEVAGAQATVAERALDVAEKQLKQLELSADEARAQYEQQLQAVRDNATAQLASAQAQIDALRSIDNSVLSVAEAIANLSAAIGSELAANNAAAAAQAQASNTAQAGRSAQQLRQMMPADWDTQYGAAEKINWFNANRVSVAELTAAGEKWEDIQWALNNGYKGFAAGGMHLGGLRLVGERGPELEVTGPSRIYSFEQTREMLGSGQRRDEALVNEIRSLREENAAQARAMVQMQQRMARVFDRWDGDGIPETRAVA